MNEFGFKGYYLFFRTLEIMSQEFDVDNPGTNTFKIRWFLDRFSRKIDRKTLEKFLNFCANSLKKRRILSSIQGNEITLTCPKLKQLADNYTEQLLRSKFEDTSKQLRKQEDRSRSKSKNKEKALKDISPKPTWLDKFLEYVNAETLPDTFKPGEKPYDALVLFARHHLAAYKEPPPIQKGKHMDIMSRLVKIYKGILPEKIKTFFTSHTVDWADHKTLEVFNSEVAKVGLSKSGSIRDGGRGDKDYAKLMTEEKK